RLTDAADGSQAIAMADMHRRHGRGFRHGRDALTRPAVPGLAHLVRMPTRFDHRPADVARESGPLVHPHPLAGIEAEVRAPLATVAVQADQPARVAHDLAQPGIVEVPYPGPRRGAREEQRLDLEDVPDARDRVLVEERRRDVAVVVRTEPSDRLVHIELVTDDVGPEPAHDAVQPQLLLGEQLDDGRVEAWRDRLLDADDHACLRLRLPPALARPIPVPLSAHPPGAVQDA